MPNAQVLQKPTIIGIEGSKIRVAHPNINGNLRTYLAAQIAAAGTTMTVYDNNGLADNDWLLVGSPGDSQTEITDVNGAVTAGQTMTVTNYLVHSHEIDAPVTLLNELGIVIYGAATDGGAGTIIESVDAVTASGRRLADAIMVQWEKDYTEITLISTDTSYAYYYATFTDGTTESDASDYVLAAGLGSTSVQYIIQQALDITGARIGERVTYPQLIRWTNDAQLAVSQFTYQHPKSGNVIRKDWGFEVADDKSTLTIATAQNTYALSSLSLKHNGNEGVISVQIGTVKPIKKVDIEEMNILLASKPYTEVASAASAADTTLTVDSVVEFADSGTLNAAGQTLTYTGTSGTTIFTGIPSSGTGSISSSLSVDDPVWQNNEGSFPQNYTIFNGNLIFDRAPASDYNNFPIRVKYFKTPTALTEASDTTAIPFSNVLQYYVASKIEERRQKDEKAQKLMDKFQKMVLDNALHDKVASTDHSVYYNFTDPYSTMIKNRTV